MGNAMSFFTVSLFMTFLPLNLNGASLKFAKEAGYETAYEQALKKAKKENKPLLFLVDTKTCPWCRKMERQTLKKTAIKNFVIKNFIPVTQYKNSGGYPKKFKPRVVPTVWFIDPKSEESYFFSYGYKSKKAFQKTLEEAVKKYKQP